MAGPIENSSKTGFFPEKKVNNLKAKSVAIPRNDSDRKAEIEKGTASDAKVDISEGIKDFSRIKKVAQNASPIDKSAKVAGLRDSIKSGTYEVNYDGLADKMLASEF